MARRRNKSKPGPKPKSEASRKGRTIGVRVTEDEYRQLEELASRQHIPVSSWARAQILKAIEPVKPPDVLFQGPVSRYEVREPSLADLEARQRKLDEQVARVEAMLEEAKRLYQAAIEAKGKEDD